ncbi:MAG: translation initiation factor IF-2 [Arachidicoccus sp.]|nr:translation initiation factor IF-2 [Arachidicoccus sp.]
MAEVKLPRLLAAAKEFNIGQETLIEFLESKGFKKEDLKPTAKLSEEQYYALQKEFQGDKLAKDKANKIEIPKSAATAAQQTEKKKKEEITEVSDALPQEILPPVNEIPEEEKNIIAEKEILPEPEVIKEIPPVIEEKIVPTEEKPELVKIEAPEIEAPKIINKIDLSAIDSSTRPKKAAVKKVQEPKSAEKTENKKPEKEVIEEKKETVETVKTEQPKPEIKAVPEITEPVIENIRAEKIEGPKILGKIELPKENDVRPKPGNDASRKRKRIPIENKRPGGGDNRPNFQPPNNNNNNNNNRPNFQHSNNNNNNRSNNQDNSQQRHNPGERNGFQRNNQQQNDHRPGNRPVARPNNRFAPQETNSEIDQKRIQDKIRETQAKLAGTTGSKAKSKAKYRREKRQEMAEAMEALEGQDKKLSVTEFITVSELANLMDVNFADVISKCMGLGIMVSINQRLDAEVIELVSEEFGYEVEFIGLEDADELDEEDEEDDAENLKPRNPIVTIMGHVDHGKTSLLDYIRRTKVASGEAGGITQHIGAYVVNVGDDKKITFLDTPGHEAFTAMRARGAKVTDIAVIVIAADDAVMPQTKEAISHAQAAGVPMIFAINKIDKDGANPQKIYEQLSQMNILVEEWGGKFQSQEISAKQGLNVDALLEKILLEAEVLELKSNPDKEATGSVVEASLDKGRGYVATLLIQNGTLHQGDLVVAGQYYGRMKAMFNELNQRIDIAGPSTPVQILGLNGAPQAGEKIKVYADEAEAKDIASKRAQIMREQGLRTRKHITLDEIGRRLALGNFKQLNIIIKGDVDGSVEALSDSLQKLSTEEIAVSVVHKAVGQISESDVLLATASDAIILGFNVRASSQASKLADTEGVEIKTYSIIYNAIEEIKSAMEGMLEPKVEEKEVATVEIREVYKFDKATVAGCYVLEGKIKRDHKIRLFRDGILVYPRTEGAYAELGSLKRFKDDMKEVAQGYECGLTLKNFADIQVGDNIVAYEQEEVKRTL